jgi:hypothetical protein
MIAFITAYDDATTANHTIVCPIIPNTILLLERLSATRENLWQQLPNYTTLFAMSHGSSDTLWDNNNNAAIKLEDIALFTDKRAFVFACYTANELGRKLKINNNIYWGYTGSIAAPTDKTVVIPFFQSIFQFIITNFGICEDRLQIDRMLHDLKNLCNAIETQLDILYESGDDVDVMESYTCLNHIWNRLRINHYAFDDVIKHPEAFAGDLL